MKSFKLTLLAITTALFLQGCGDNSDSDGPSTTPPNQSDINTKIVGMWTGDDSGNGLSAIVFMEDGTYIQTQVNDSRSTSDSENGMESGTYSIDNKTGKLTATPTFDKNGSSGLSDAINRFAQVSDGKLILNVDENNNSVIDSNETYKFSKVKPKGILGSWSFDGADEDELAGVAFLENNTYIYVQVDKAGLASNPENGMEWGSYTIDATTKELKTTQFYDDNGGTGLSGPRTRYAHVSGDTALTIEIDENQNGMIDNDESFTFSRNASDRVTSPNKMLSGLWRMNLGNEELVTLSFLDDGTYVQTQVTGTTSSRDEDNGIEWGKYSLKTNGELKIDNVIFDTNGTSGLSDDVLRTVQISGNTLTLGVDENNDGVIKSNESYMFSKAQSKNELGIWKATAGQVDDELILVGFLDNQTFFHIEVDEKSPFEESNTPSSGMDWNLYTLSNNGLFTLGQSLYSNTGGNNLSSAFIQMNIKVVGDTLTFNGYEDQTEVQNDDGETVIFDRQ